MPPLLVRVLNQIRTSLYDYYIYLHDCYTYLYLLVLLEATRFRYFRRQSLPIVNYIYGLNLSLNQFESTRWSRPFARPGHMVRN